MLQNYSVIPIFEPARETKIWFEKSDTGSCEKLRGELQCPIEEREMTLSLRYREVRKIRVREIRN